MDRSYCARVSLDSRRGGNQNDLDALLNGNHDPSAVNAAVTQAQAAYQQVLANGTATATMKAQLDAVTNHLQAMHAHQRSIQDHQDFEKVATDAQAWLKEAGVSVGDDYARRWLLAEARLNPALTQAFDNRYQSPGFAIASL